MVWLNLLGCFRMQVYNSSQSSPFVLVLRYSDKDGFFFNCGYPQNWPQADAEDRCLVELLDYLHMGASEGQNPLSPLCRGHAKWTDPALADSINSLLGTSCKPTRPPRAAAAGREKRVFEDKTVEAICFDQATCAQRQPRPAPFHAIL